MYRRRATTAELAAHMLPAVQIGILLPLAVVVLYWVKSALGIDLMDGPSPLHFLYWR